MLKKLSVVLMGAAVCVAWGFELNAADYPYGAYGGGSRGYQQPSQSYSGGMGYSYDSGYRSYSYDPGYRSFSYEPSSFAAGDMVVVTGDNAQMKRGTDVLGNVPNGTEFKVTQVKDGWLGASVDVDGNKLNGWIHSRNVRMANSDDASNSNDQADASSTQETRRFSYEPQAQVNRQYRSNQSNDSSARPWTLQRTNPNRAK